MEDPYGRERFSVKSFFSRVVTPTTDDHETAAGVVHPGGPSPSLGHAERERVVGCPLAAQLQLQAR